MAWHRSRSARNPKPRGHFIGAGRNPRRPAWASAILFSLAIVVGSFILATIYTQHRLSAIDAAAADIVDNASPSIRRLSEARTELRHLQVLLHEDAERIRNGDVSRIDAIRASSERIDENIDAYLALPTFPGEKELWTEIVQARKALDEILNRQISALASAERLNTEPVVDPALSNAAARMSYALGLAIEFNAAHARDLAVSIGQYRSRSTAIALGLDLICVLVTFLAARALWKTVSDHSALLERHRKLHAERARELEEFAGRVAHDILGPVNAVGLALEISANTQAEPERVQALERGRAALARAQGIIQGLLGFARAGARPEPGARADIGETLHDLWPELEWAARPAGVSLHLEAPDACLVACDRGILTSILSNLAYNAIKYGRESPDPRVSICVSKERGRARVEVQDTGPGLAPGLEHSVFNPYVRANGSRIPGIGLGLATVRRIVEAHAGTVGVRSKPGAGCTFWFELPTHANE